MPAINPVVQAAWKLKPPVMPSIFNASPAKYKPFVCIASRVQGFMFDNAMPPDVTNSSLNVVLPFALKGYFFM